jgi:hypothetical protein
MSAESLSIGGRRPPLQHASKKILSFGVRPNSHQLESRLDGLDVDDFASRLCGRLRAT